LEKLFKFPFRAMAVDCELQIFAGDQAQASSLATRAIAEIQRIEAKFSRYQGTSVIARINANAGEVDGIDVDDETAALLDYAGVIFQESAGLFDVTSGVLRSVWDFRSGRVPSERQVAELLPLIGWQQVEWNRPRIRLPHKGMQLDFGGFGKEYAVDRAAGLLAADCGLAGLINLGGDVRVFGDRPDSKPWIIGIAHPRIKSALIASIPLISGSIATSGDYERCIEQAGVRYSHILSPYTGWPVLGFQSVSVSSPSCLIAGSISTTAMLKGEQAGREYLDLVGIPALIVSLCGETIVLAGELDRA